MKRIPFIIQFKHENPSIEELQMTDIIGNAIYNYETLARRRLVRWFLLSFLLALVAIAGVGYVGWKSTMDERTIIAELKRQVGKTSPTLGYKEGKYILDADGKRILKADRSDWRREIHPRGIWDVLEAQQRRLAAYDRHLGPFLNEQANLQNYMLSQINVPELQILNDDRFWDAVRVELLEKDTDGDGVKNAVDNCVDVPGQPFDAVSRNWYEQGCPVVADRDNDGIADFRDACPDETGDGTRRNLDVMTGPRSGFGADTGCLDSDGDYIVNRDDLCPTVAAADDYNGDGCTDADTDVTPFLAREGIVSFEGFRLDDKTVKAYWATRRIVRGDPWTGHIACVPHGADGAVMTAIPADGAVQPPSVSDCRAVASVPELPAAATP